MSLTSEVLAVVPATVVFTECLFRCPLVAITRSMSKVAAKSLRVVSSRRISEHWKEAVLVRYSGMLLVTSCLAFVWLIAFVAAFIVVFGLTKYLFAGELTIMTAVPSVFETAAASVVGVLYGFARAKHGRR